MVLYICKLTGHTVGPFTIESKGLYAGHRMYPDRSDSFCIVRLLFDFKASSAIDDTAISNTLHIDTLSNWKSADPA